MCQGNNASISQILALYKTDSSQLGKLCQVSNASVSQSGATSQIDISNSVAGLDKLDDGVVSQINTMTQMNVMQILGKLSDRGHCSISDVPALGEY